MPDKNWELLAPAGKMDMLLSVFEAGADAAYLGGKKFNMRMLKAEYNFSDEEMQRAVEIAHQGGKNICNRKQPVQPGRNRANGRISVQLE
jgi:putative protease